ncbi:MAG TPA: sigma-70 family RNA polymerase sigma factor [Acidimicrobiales bacterium]|nr:sigma-70 family RNA polymerase sigma factor [Acidimicrobiales bacterium]
MTELARGASAASADGAAFEAAHAELVAPATRYAAVILGAERHSALADVMQDVWTRAWAAWPPAQMERRDAWLFRIVRNRCLDEHRRARRLPRSLDTGDDLAATDDPEASALAEEALRLLAGLPPPLREALWLRAVDDRSYADIAALQGVPIGTVMSRIHAARRRLSRELGR